MEPLYFKVPRNRDETVRVEHWNQPKFYEPFHYHEECQLTFLLSGCGTAFMGSSIVEYRKGDLFFMGKNLPHVLRSDRQGRPGQKHGIRAISIFFSLDNLFRILNEIADTERIKKILNDSVFGLKFRAVADHKIGSLMHSIGDYNGFSRLLVLLQIIDLCSTYPAVEQLVLKRTTLPNSRQQKNLNRVFNYVMEHYREKITLDAISELVCMTPNAFCRYFKKHTQKSFSSFLIEVRINKACKMLQDEANSVSDSCYASGYNNISNYHRHFRRITGLTPNEYKKQLSNSG